MPESDDYDPLQPHKTVNIPRPPAPKQDQPEHSNDEVDYDPLNLPATSKTTNKTKPKTNKPQSPQEEENEDEADQPAYNPLNFATNSFKSGPPNQNFQNNPSNNRYQQGGQQVGRGQGDRINYGMNQRSSQQGQTDELFSRSVFISGLNYDSREEDIRGLFSQCGEIRELNVPKYQDTQRNIGYGHLTFGSPEEKAKVLLYY